MGCYKIRVDCGKQRLAAHPAQGEKAHCLPALLAKPPGDQGLGQQRHPSLAKQPDQEKAKRAGRFVVYKQAIERARSLVICGGGDIDCNTFTFDSN